MTDPKIDTYDTTSKKPGYVIASASVIAVLGLLATAWVAKYTIDQKNPSILYGAIGAWAIVAPFWFWYEYFRLYRKHGRSGTLELFKHGQQVAAAIWAGVLAALIAFAANEPWKDPDDVIRRSHDAVSELKASVLIELRETQGNGLTSVELEKKIKISPELISAVLSDLQEDEQVEYDEQTMRWDLPK